MNHIPLALAVLCLMSPGTVYHVVIRVIARPAIDNYGEKYAGKVFTVRAVYTHHCKVADMDIDPTGHPGYDTGMGPLYGSNELNFDLYEWEMRRA